MQLPEEPESSPQINIVPMIDAIFAILAFFIMSTLFLTRSLGLPVTLPKASSGIQQPQEQIVVTLDRQGGIFLNQTPTDLDTLADDVRSLTEAADPLVIINADAAAHHGQVVAVMDRLRSVEGIRLAIATQTP